MKTEELNCLKCKNYYVTWEAAFPRGCRLFGFKSKQMPSVLVMQATGIQCKNYDEKIKDK